MTAFRQHERRREGKIRQLNLIFARSVPDRKIKSPDFLWGERPSCQSNKTTIFLVLGLRFFPLELKIILTEFRSRATEIQDDCLPFLSDRCKARTTLYRHKFYIARKIYFYFMSCMSFKQFEVNLLVILLILLTPTLGGSRDNPKIGHFVDLFSQLADEIKTWQLHQCKVLTSPYTNM